MGSWTPTKKIEGYPYCVFVEGYQLMSKLLRVTRESREVALKFYRVHIPCKFITTEPEERTIIIDYNKTKSGTLHYNPEYDFLHIYSRIPGTNWVINFLQDLKTLYDPLHVGLRNLAIDHTDLLATGWSDLDARDRTAFIELITQLHEVFFLLRSAVGRTLFGLMSGMTVHDVYFNRSLPIMPLAPRFERSYRDPRPIAEDLGRFYIGMTESVPRKWYNLWRQRLREWGVSPTGIEYQWLVAHIGWGCVYDRAGAASALQKEYDEWRNDPVVLQMPEEVSESAVKTAFGFWLFPLESFGQFTNEGDPESQENVPYKCEPRDMTEYWPELALSSLP
jgi:hypothetical protein